MSCKPNWLRCVAPEQSFYEYKMDGKVPQRRYPKVSRNDEHQKRNTRTPASGPTLLSPWRREVLRMEPPTESDLSLLSGVSSLDTSHFRCRDTRDFFTECSRRPHPRGQLNINVEVCEGFISMFVGGVRNIRRHDLATPCYFVQLSVIPQETGKVNTLVTSMKHERDPVFDEVFMIAPHTTSGRPRLLIEVMSIGEDHRQRLVGCMSFGIRPLLAQRKSISGWYYLLNDELGQRKHFRVQHQIEDEHAIHVHRHAGKPARSVQSSHARSLLDQTYMSPAADSLESLDFTARSRHDLTLSSTLSSTCGSHQIVKRHHPVLSLNASKTSTDNTSGYSTCSSGLSARVNECIYEDQESTYRDDEFDERPSENWSFLAAFDNFRSEDIATYSTLSYRKGEESRLFWQSEFIWMICLLYVNSFVVHVSYKLPMMLSTSSPSFSTVESLR